MRGLGAALRHIGIVAGGLLLLLVLPGLCVGAPALLTGAADAVSGASMELPEQPSGDFIVLLNTDRHPLTVDEWTAFFEEREVGVIMEDISCLTAAADASGTRLAERYQARLAEHQMTLTRENGMLVVSRAENGLYDVVILSREMAESYDLSAACARPEAAVVTVTGGAEG